MSCYLCKETEDTVFTCEKKHNYCQDCAEERCYKCRCGALLRLVRHELEKNCKYKGRGCELIFTSAKNLSEHESECKFRPYNCVGDRMNVWRCNWTGKQHEIGEHFLKDHSSIKNYEFSGKLEIDFLPENEYAEMKQINFINAFNKRFIFFYKSDYKNELLIMMIFLLGRKKDANKYFYELQIFSELDERVQVKFTMPVYNETENIEQYIIDGKCIHLTYNFIKNFVRNNKVLFRYKMCNKDKN